MQELSDGGVLAWSSNNRAHKALGTHIDLKLAFGVSRCLRAGLVVPRVQGDQLLVLLVLESILLFQPHPTPGDQQSVLGVL
ncbi:hypothetical protein HHX47_DHR4000614 [Lentinula edodes]|nr:hypothetical protein HHX47_DHR4000614 [Lentinula edodes]